MKRVTGLIAAAIGLSLMTSAANAQQEINLTVAAGQPTRPVSAVMREAISG